MPTQEEVDGLKQRIAQLEAELAKAKSAPGELFEAEVKNDQEWGEFNPG
ncbi:MAG TPA: hypothetical protein PKV13_13460 [Propionicimonas sp.]|nr:hypothetical protein [Propionicimonas sp.]